MKNVVEDVFHILIYKSFFNLRMSPKRQVLLDQQAEHKPNREPSVDN